MDEKKEKSMDKSQMLKILQEEGIIIKEETNGYAEIMQDMEYHSELLREEGEWKLVLHKRGKVEEKARFEDEDEAIKYFFLHEIKTNVVMKKLAVIRRKTEVLYEENVQLEDMYKVFEENRISKEFYNKGNGYAVNVEKKGDMYDVYVSNPDGKKIYGALKLLNKRNTCMIMFNWVFCIKLFINLYSKYLEKGIIEESLSSLDIIFMLDGSK